MLSVKEKLVTGSLGKVNFPQLPCKVAVTNYRCYLRTLNKVVAPRFSLSMMDGAVEGFKYATKLYSGQHPPGADTGGGGIDLDSFFIINYVFTLCEFIVFTMSCLFPLEKSCIRP